MKLRLKGVANRDDVIKAFTKALEVLDVDFDRHCLNGVNIYFNVFEINGDAIEFVDKSGEILDFIEYTTRNKSQTTKKTVYQGVEGKSITRLAVVSPSIQRHPSLTRRKARITCITKKRRMLSCSPSDSPPK